MNDQLRTLIADKGNRVHSIEPTATVLEAVRRMNDQGIGALLVTRGGAPVGIFTERDILRRVIARGLDPSTTPLGEVMTREMFVVSPTVTVGEAMAIITAKRIRHLPVVENGKLVGLVSSGDLTRWVSRGRENEIQQLVEFITGKYPA
jgi:CBS domain-containing protein